MNNRINRLIDDATTFEQGPPPSEFFDKELFAKLVVIETLRQVQNRMYSYQDRTWSASIDDMWVKLEFGFGELAKARKGAGIDDQ